MIDQRNTEHQSLCTSNPFLYSRVMDIEHLLNMAFNPVTELRSKTPLAMLLNKHSNIVPVENTLTSAERIAESAVVRNNLENNLSH
ncbi:MAG: hypothetical protein JAY71_18875, partial [Candidatus Thiodiazotropha weberae]|nr:hypothetical protein [Candidatus Thiodiazotropha weberae]